MKLTASVICRDELDRFLGPCLEHLLEFCDEVRILDDASQDGWEETLRPSWGDAGKKVIVRRRVREGNKAFETHASGRNELLHFTLEGDPTFVLAIDCDEAITDGARLRAACETARTDVVTVDISEAWEICDDVICTREDGGWRTHPIGAVWRAETFRRQALMLTDKDTATGRVPDAVHRKASVSSGSALLHLGWSCESDRQERYKRHVGSSHAGTHVQSILWDDTRVKLAAREWPVGWSPELRAAVLERANRQ